MRFGVALPSFGHFAEPERLANAARLCERRGWDGFFLWDHLLWAREGPIPVLDPWTELRVAAEVTERVILGILVAPIAVYHPIQLARAVLTLEHVSCGRMVLGVGVGTDPDFRPLIAPVGDDASEGELRRDRARRGRRYRSTLEVLRPLLSGSTVSYHGEFFNLDQVLVLPAPVGERVIPIWISGDADNRRALMRAARYEGAVPLVFTAGAPARALTVEEVQVYRHQLDNLGGRSTDFAYWHPCDGPLLDSAAEEIAAAGATWWIETVCDGSPTPDASESWALITKTLSDGPPPVARTPSGVV
jgi:alkanesulfonate monooxygenase SsuD/methylene tetrahydromethanopterin reductase-like flavin-dependent oxidoreductase (luciferase family)